MSGRTAAALAAAHAGLYALGFFPADLGFLGWAALVPVAALARVAVRPAARYAAAWLGGVAFFGVGAGLTIWPAWVRTPGVVEFIPWAALVVYCGLYLPVAVGLVRLADRAGVPLAVSLPAAWAGLEAVRSVGPWGFGWYLLGHTQHHALPVVQAADLGGAYLVSAELAAANAVLFLWLCRIPAVAARLRVPPPPPPVASTLAVAGVVAAGLGYGAYRLAEPPPPGRPLRVALLQTDVPHYREAGGADKAAERASRTEATRELCDRAARLDPRPDLIVWPETGFYPDWRVVPPGVAETGVLPDWAAAAAATRATPGELAARWRTNLLVGVNVRTWDPGGRHTRSNSAVLVRADGTPGGRYDKVRCVPFAEAVPFKGAVPALAVWSGQNGDDVTAGDAPVPLTFTAADGRPVRVGPLICFDSTDGRLARAYLTDPGGPADLLANVSNDGWFGGSWEHEQHLVVSRFRAVECRRPVVRAVNRGISAVVDGCGRVTALPAATWAGSKRVEAVVAADVPADDRVSPYVAAGDWFAAACGMTAAAAALAGVVRPVRRPGG